MASFFRRRDWSKRSGRRAAQRTRLRRSEQLEPRYALSASAVGDAFGVNDFTPGHQSIDESTVAVAASSVNRVVVWEGRGVVDREGVFARVYDESGQALGESFRVNDTIRGQQYAPSVAVADDGSFVVAWAGRGVADKHGVFIKRFDSDGAALGDEVLVNSTLGGVQTSPSIAIGSNGVFIVSWEGAGVGDASGVFFRRFNSEGSLSTTEVRANTTTDNDQTDAVVESLAGNEFVIGWQSRQQDGSDWGVFAQQYNSTALTLGSETRLSTTTAASQTGLAIAVDPTGGFVAAWESHDQDGDGLGVVAREFAADGTPSGDEMVINAETAGNQYAPALAVAADGQWIVAWTSVTDDGAGLETHTRSIEADGTAGASAIVHSGLSGLNSDFQKAPAIAIDDRTAWITWSGAGPVDPDGVHAQGYNVTLADDGVQVAPSIAAIADQSIDEGGQLEVTVTATDANAFDTLTFALDTDNSPSGATIEQIDNNTAIVRWTPAAGDTGQTTGFRVEVTDNGSPSLADVEEFTVTVNEIVQVAPDLAAIADQTIDESDALELTVTATDANSGDTLTFFLDAGDSPAGATLEQVDNNTAIIRWTPSSGDAGQTVDFRVLVTDDGDPVLVDAESFIVTVTDLPVAVDANGSSASGDNEQSDFIVGDVDDAGVAVVSSLAPDLEISGASMISSATARLTAAPDGVNEVLSVQTPAGGPITAAYSAATSTLTLSGSASAAEYESVLRTLVYNNSADRPEGTRAVVVTVIEEGGTEADSSQIDVDIVNPDLVAFAQALTDAGVVFFGAGWCPVCTAQKELFEDGQNLLDFREVTNPDRSLNSVGAANNITSFPTWDFPDGTRIEGYVNLATLSAVSGVAIPTTDTPFLAELADETLLVGSPLHVPLDGYDPDGRPLTYTVTSDNPDVSAEILTGNRSARIDVAGYGDLVFELFEQRAPLATQNLIDLAESGFYEGSDFHRIVNDFVIQGGIGAGGVGSPLGNFDDQFDPDLQHNRTGLLSMAKAADDTNNSQFFVTEGENTANLRNLDFNHTVFGILVEGESNRAAISDTAVNGSSPINSVGINDIDIFDDSENAVLFLKAADNATGTANITVTVTDADGNETERTFTVTLAEDTFNGRPYLINTPAVTTVPRNTTAQIQLESNDVEGDEVFYFFDRLDSVPYAADLSDNGLLVIEPPDDFTGTITVGVLVGDSPTRSNPPANQQPDEDFQVIQIEFT